MRFRGINYYWRFAFLLLVSALVIGQTTEGGSSFSTTKKTWIQTIKDNVINMILPETNCSSLVATVQPDEGIPSTVFLVICHCSQTSSVCPKLTVDRKAAVILQRTASVTKGHCLLTVQLKVNTRSSEERIDLKCSFRGLPSSTSRILIRKADNGKPCDQHTDCRFPQQECLFEDGRFIRKVCRCPNLNDVFDPSREPMCFQDAVPESADKLGLIHISIIVIAVVIVVGTALSLIKVFIKCRTPYSRGNRSEEDVEIRGEGGERNRRRRRRSSHRSRTSDKPPDYEEVQKNDEAVPPPTYSSVFPTSNPHNSCPETEKISKTENVTVAEGLQPV